MEATKEIKEISKLELVNLLNEVDKSTFVNLVTETKLRMRKTNNPYADQIIKRVKRNYLIGNSYEDRVNKNEVKEGLDGTFKAKENKVGKHISKVVIFNESTNKYYMVVEPFEEIKPTDTTYLYEGNEIDVNLFKDFIQVSKPSQSRQSQDKKVLYQNFTFESIKEITLNKETYKVV